MVDYKLVKILENIAFLLEFSGENKFKAVAYSKAASIIEDEEVDVHLLVKNGNINQINGFGDALVKKITDYVLNGKMEFYENLIQKVPEQIADLNQISGLGVSKIRFLVENFSIKSIEDLENAIENNLLVNAKGFTPKAILGIKNSISKIKSYKSSTYLHIAYDEANDIIKRIKSHNHTKQFNIEKIAIVGDLKRYTEVVSKIDIVIGLDVDLNADVKNNIVEIEKYIKDILLDYNLQLSSLDDSNIIIGVAKCRVKLNLFIVGNDDFAVACHNLTTSNEYLEAYKEYISYSGLKFENYKLIDSRNNVVKIEKESELYNNIGLKFVEPENRDDAQTVEFAMKSALPITVGLNDLRGMLHCHSTWSDGKNTLKEMALETQRLGFEYFGICDHSKTAAYANGLSIDRVLEQHQLIEELNNEFKSNNSNFRIIKGIESDILIDGSLDYPDEILEKFDFVVASVHSGFNMGLNEMTERVSKALSNKYTTILGHPTGRILLQRESYQIDLNEILRVAADNNKIMEINASPYRLDLNTEWASKCKALNLKIAINPDAHNTKGLKHIKYGLFVGRKAFLESKDVVNTLNLKEFMNLSKQIRNFIS